MNECPTRVRIGVPPCSRMISGTAFEQMRLCTTVSPGWRSRMAAATIAVVVDPRPAAPDRRRARRGRRRRRTRGRCRRRASSTARCRSLRFSSWIGSAGWFGKVPSSSPKSTVRSNGRPSNTLGTTTRPCRWRCRRRPAAAQGVEVDERVHVRAELLEHVDVIRLARDLAPRRQPDATISLIWLQPGLLADRRRAGPAQLDAVVLRRVVARGEHRGGRVEACRRRSRRRRWSTARGR